MLIDGISALVTGGASGLGLATAKELVERGAFVTIVDLPVSDGAAVAKELGDRVRFAPADITSEEEVRSAIAAAEQAPAAGAGALRGTRRRPYSHHRQGAPTWTA